jgi:hypothetical protein
MTATQQRQFNEMLSTLRKISKGYANPSQLQRDSKSSFGLNYTECLEMAYENIQSEAATASRGVKEIKSAKKVIIPNVPESDIMP